MAEAMSENAARVIEGLNEVARIEAIVYPIRSDFTGWCAANPSLAKAAGYIGPALGIGPIAAAQTIALYRDWIS